jgi:hypothetical protein
MLPDADATVVHWIVADPKATHAGDCFEGAKSRGQQGLNTRAPFLIGQLQTAQDPHQIVNLTSCVSPARFKVLLQTQTRKESQDHTG